MTLQTNPLKEDIVIDERNPEFQDVLKLIRFTRNSVFLTGKAGTGKSTLLKYICAHTRKKHVVLAPTGIAAINAGGATLHSFFKLPFYPLLPDDPRFSFKKLRDFLKYNSAHQKLIREVELIIIDEISMVRADIIDFIDRVLRLYGRNLREPFGGKQLLLVGDIFQLEPVVKSNEREMLNRYYPTPYFFSAKVFETMKLVSIELTKVYRQKDAAFIAVLDHIRTNQAGNADLQLLNTRYGRDNDGKLAHGLSITLATRRDNVDFINRGELAKIDSPGTFLHGDIQGEFPENSLPTLMELELKPGAQVIFVKNDPDKRWVNGTLGTVSAIDEENGLVYVVTEDGKEMEVEQTIWENVRYTYNSEEKKIEEEVIGTFRQFPLRLAWAITVHKSQGLTFRKVTIDFSGGVFAGGQAYVALSRCTSLEGIALKREISRSDIFVKPEIVRFSQQFNDPEAIGHALKKAQADIAYQAAVQAFDKGDFQECLDHFFTAIHSRYDIEKPTAKRLIRRKLDLINQLKAENQELKTRLSAQREQMKGYAKEYYELGNASILQAHNARAAVANYDKALALDPTFIDAYIRKGVTLQDRGDYSAALACFNQAGRLSKANFKVHYNRGKNHLDCGRTEQAVADFDKAVSLKPEHAKAHELFGNALARAGKEEEAAIQWAIAESLREKRQRNS